MNLRSPAPDRIVTNKLALDNGVKPREISEIITDFSHTRYCHCFESQEPRRCRVRLLRNCPATTEELESGNCLTPATSSRREGPGEGNRASLATTLQHVHHDAPGPSNSPNHTAHPLNSGTSNPKIAFKSISPRTQ